MSDVLTTVSPSIVRRTIGVGVLFALGLLLLWLGLTRPQDVFAWRIAVIAIGFGALWLAEKMRRATSGRLELREDGIFDQTGRLVAGIDDIVSIERGMLAFKPSNGFMVHLKTRHKRVWAPGLWWRLGKRVGIGGVTSASETKAMAEMLAALQQQRSAADKSD